MDVFTFQLISLGVIRYDFWIHRSRLSAQSHFIVDSHSCENMSDLAGFEKNGGFLSMPSDVDDTRDRRSRRLAKNSPAGTAIP